MQLHVQLCYVTSVDVLIDFSFSFFQQSPSQMCIEADFPRCSSHQPLKMPSNRDEIHCSLIFCAAESKMSHQQ